MKYSELEEIRGMWLEAYNSITEVEFATSCALEEKCYNNDEEKSELLDIAIMCRKIIRFSEGD